MKKRSVFIVTISLLVNFGTPFLTFPLLTRAFDITTYGYWIETNTIVSLLCIFSTQGLANGVSAQIVSEHKSQQEAIFNNALYLFLGLTTILALLVCLGAP